MKYREMDEHTLMAAVYGGAVLGGGGGGKMEDGLLRGRMALEHGKVLLADLEELEDTDCVMTVSSVGSPASKTRFIKPENYARAAELLLEDSGRQVSGFITNECGGAASINGWIQSAYLGIPVLDCSCNGRAHPTGTMGSMGLDQLEGYRSRQSATGGNPEDNTYVEMVFEGNARQASGMVRKAADMAGGVVGVARNFIDAGYVKKNGAVGAISHAISIGEKMLPCIGRPEKMISAIQKATGGACIRPLTIEKLEMVTENALDVGRLIAGGREGKYEISLVNEYLTLEKDEERLATFPDLINLLDLATGLPLLSAALEEGMKIAVLIVPASKLKLGKGMYQPECYPMLEEMVGKPLASYVFGAEKAEKDTRTAEWEVYDERD